MLHRSYHNPALVEVMLRVLSRMHGGPVRARASASGPQRVEETTPATKPRRTRRRENKIAIELLAQLLRQKPIKNDDLYKCLVTKKAPDGTPLIWEDAPLTWDGI